MMKVLMIGDSHVGKTTYMTALYRAFSGRGLELCLHVKDRRDHKTLRRFGKELFTQGIYPDKTALKSDYTFSLGIAGNRDDGDELIHFFDFQWMDYPGGVIYQPTTEPIPEELARKLDCAETLVVFLDYTQLNSPSMKRQWMRIKQFILKFAGRARKDNPLCLTIILTKCDIDIDFKLSESKVFNNLDETLSSLSHNQYLHGMLARSAINQNSSEDVFAPFIFSIRMGLIKELSRLDETNDPLEKMTSKFFLNISNNWTEIINSNDGFDKGGYILF